MGASSDECTRLRKFFESDDYTLEDDESAESHSGLEICKKIAAINGGKIRLSSAGLG